MGGGGGGGRETGVNMGSNMTSQYLIYVGEYLIGKAQHGDRYLVYGDNI